MTTLDRQIRATLQTLVALQGAKILQVEKENADMKRELERLRKLEKDRKAAGNIDLYKVEVQA